MASLAHLLIRTLCILLIAAFGTVASFAAPGDWTRISYPVEAQELFAQPINLTNAARAPPHTRANVMAAGTAFAQTGDLRALDGVEATGVVYVFLHSSIAPNSETTTLYRAVSPEEYRDIMETGQFRPNPSGDGFQFGKQFGNDLDETIDFADQYPDIGGVVRVEAPNNFLDEIDIGPQVDTNIFPSGTVTIDVDDLDAFNGCTSGICDALE